MSSYDGRACPGTRSSKSHICVWVTETEWACAGNVEGRERWIPTVVEVLLDAGLLLQRPLHRKYPRHLANRLPVPPLVEPEQPHQELQEDQPSIQSTQLQPQDMTYCTAPDTTSTDADTTIIPGPSVRGRGIPRGRVTSARGRVVTATRAPTTAGESGVKKKAAMTPVERRKREVGNKSLVWI